LLRIRLSRIGKKKQPAYRLVVADSRAPREGAFLKIIGHYNPLTQPVTLTVKEDEAVYWLQKGAQPSETAAKLLTRLGVMEKAGKAPVKYEGKKVEPAPKKTKGEPRAAAAPEAPAKAPEPAAEEPAAEAAPEAAEEPAAEDPAVEAAPEAEATAEAEVPVKEAAAEEPAETEGESTESKE
jgi:small subunit ribosomal protein S16